MKRPETLIKEVEKLGFKTFKSSEYKAIVCVSTEHGDNAADYYGEYRGGYPWINPKLEKLAIDNGCYWEWFNPGAIGLYRI